MSDEHCDLQSFLPTNDFDCHRIIDVAEMFLQESLQEISYSRIADIARQITSAKIVLINLYEPSGLDYWTVAMVGVEDEGATVRELLGFEVVGSRWSYDPAKADRIAERIVTRFDTLHELTARRIPVDRVLNLESRLELGPVWVAAIRKDERMLGDLVIIGKAGAALQNEPLLQLYVRLVGLFFTRRATELALQKSHERYLLAVNGNRDGIWDWDIVTGDLFLSARWKEMLGYRDHEIPNVIESFRDHLHPEDRPRVMKYVDGYLKGEIRNYQTEFRMRCKDGAYIWVLARGEALYDESGRPYCMAGSHTDITEKKEFDRRLEELASTDVLTGLWNRRHFFTAGATELARCRRYKSPFSMLMMDLDHFKRINDEFGHAAGDEVLRAMAALLKRNLRDVDVPARIGGEEFAVLLPSTGLEGALVAAERVRRSVEAVRVSFDGRELGFTVSIGVAGCCAETRDLDALMKAADAALYRAKEAGRNCCRTEINDR